MTCSADKTVQLAAARRQVFLALFIALAIMLHLLEALMPSPLPWLKLGLANIMTLAALYLYDGRAAWTVSLTRVVVGALLLGRIFSPGFWLALCGAIVATSVMIILYRAAQRRLSPIGVSVAGAAGHAMGQLLAARLLVIQHEAIWQIMPVFLLFTIFSGILTGWLAAVLLEEFRQHEAFQAASASEEGNSGES
ncbi:MAG: hypothetical protein GTO62_16695 [Planctomycetales bacterium]|nr:hypothetical protein [Planctomycetales bacterium]